MEFVLALHSHLPYVLNHGRWPHGSDWLCEAALDTYLPLLERLEELAAEGTPTPLTIGFTRCWRTSLRAPPSPANWRRSSRSGWPPATKRPRRCRRPVMGRWYRSWTTGGRASPACGSCSGESTEISSPPFAASRSRVASRSSDRLPRTATCRCSVG